MSDDIIEQAYWKFDAMRNGYAEWSNLPKSERDAFKLACTSVVEAENTQLKAENADLLDNLSRCKGNELAAEVEQLKAELTKLKEWQQIILGTGTDQEAVIRMAATKYTEVAVQSWREEVGKLKAELAQATAREARLREALRIHAGYPMPKKLHSKP